MIAWGMCKQIRGAAIVPARTVISIPIGLVPVRIGLIFAVARRGHSQDLEVVLCPLKGQGKGSLLDQRSVVEGAAGCCQGVSV